MQTQAKQGFLDRFFKLSEKNTTVKTELLAGLTTFIALAYIIFVNPNILSEAGIPKEAAIASTIWIAALSTMVMGVFANYPVALAPGMGLNAFFAYYVCGTLGLHWTVALGAVFFSGVLFLILTILFAGSAHPQRRHQHEPAAHGRDVRPARHRRRLELRHCLHHLHLHGRRALR